MRNRVVTAFAFLFLIGVAINSSACGDFFVSGSTLDHITLTPTSVYLKTTETKQFSASAVNVDGSTSDATSSATWTTAAPTIATANAGLVTAVGPGNTTVTATQSGVAGTGNVVVNTQSLNTALTITPNNPTVVANQTVQLTATGTFADNSTTNLTSFVTWSSSNTANATVSSSGLVTGVLSGQTATITATIATSSGSSTGSVSVTVQ
jgi:uncharacterized protein YjdB